MSLPFVGPIHGLPHSIAQHRQHNPNARIVLALAGFRRSRRRKERATEGAAQSFQFEDRGLEDGLSDDANDLGGLAEKIEPALQTLGAEMNKCISSTLGAPLQRGGLCTYLSPDPFSCPFPCTQASNQPAAEKAAGPLLFQPVTHKRGLPEPHRWAESRTCASLSERVCGLHANRESQSPLRW
jgi:hypothetical protein